MCVSVFSDAVNKAAVSRKALLLWNCFSVKLKNARMSWQEILQMCTLSLFLSNEYYRRFTMRSPVLRIEPIVDRLVQMLVAEWRVQSTLAGKIISSQVMCRDFESTGALHQITHSSKLEILGWEVKRSSSIAGSCHTAPVKEDAKSTQACATTRLVRLSN